MTANVQNKSLLVALAPPLKTCSIETLSMLKPFQNQNFSPHNSQLGQSEMIHVAIKTILSSI